MRILIIISIAICSVFSGYAQKSKANTANAKSSLITVQYACPMHSEVVSNKPGKCPTCHMDLSLSKKEQMKREVTKLYSCPMHQEVVNSNPGTCAKCGSKLVVDRRGSKQATSVFSCSMHPNIAQTKAGKCPVCGMALTEGKAKAKS